MAHGAHKVCKGLRMSQQSTKDAPEARESCESARSWLSRQHLSLRRIPFVRVHAACQDDVRATVPGQGEGCGARVRASLPVDEGYFPTCTVMGNRYRVERLLCEGSQKRIYVAQDTYLPRRSRCRLSSPTRSLLTTQRHTKRGRDRGAGERQQRGLLSRRRARGGLTSTWCSST